MLQLNLKPLFAARGIDRPYYFLKKHGFSHEAANSLRSGKRIMIDVRHMEKLCEILWCEPNDLFEWYPASERIIPDAHPLFNLKTGKEATINISKMTASIPYKDLKQLSATLAKEIEAAKKV